MARGEDDIWGAEPMKKPAAHQIGEPLDRLSVDEIDERIALLRAEITRLERQREQKESSRLAAHDVFKR